MIGIIAAAMAVNLSACGAEPSAQSSPTNDMSTTLNSDLEDELLGGNDGSEQPALDKIETIGPTGEKVILDLLPSPDPSQTAGMAAFIEEAGFKCDRVSDFHQLQQADGKPLDIFKIDCANGQSFQATMINDKSFIKPWTGRIFGT